MLHHLLSILFCRSYFFLWKCCFAYPCTLNFSVPASLVVSKLLNFCFGIWLKLPERNFYIQFNLKLKTRHMCFVCAWCLYDSIVVLDINLDSFFPCNQLTATSYIYQSLGDVEWYVRWSSRHDNHETRGSLSSPQAQPTPSCGRLPWSEPPRALGTGMTGWPKVLGPWGALRTPVVLS